MWMSWTGVFRRLKRGRHGQGKTKRGKGSKVMAVGTKKSRPLALQVFSATPFESTLLEETIRKRFSKTEIRRIVATGLMIVTR
jgi:hypothetical protein